MYTRLTLQTKPPFASRFSRRGPQEIIEAERVRLAYGEKFLRRTAIAVFVCIVTGILLAVYFIETPQRLFDSYVKSVKRSEQQP